MAKDLTAEIRRKLREIDDLPPEVLEVMKGARKRGITRKDAIRMAKDAGKEAHGKKTKDDTPPAVEKLIDRADKMKITMKDIERFCREARRTVHKRKR